MIAGAIKNQVDQIWNTFWSGGVSNPLSVIEQITYLLFAKRLDELHTAKEKQASLLGNTYILALANMPFKSDFSDSDTRQWLVTNGQRLTVDFIDLFFAQD